MINASLVRRHEYGLLVEGAYGRQTCERLGEPGKYRRASHSIKALKLARCSKIISRRDIKTITKLEESQNLLHNAQIKPTEREKGE